MPRERAQRPDTTKDHVVIISGSVGAGHDGAANVLAARLREVGVSVDVRDYLLALPPPIRTILRRGYTASIRFRPGVLQWLFTSAEQAAWMAAVIDWMCWLAQRRVRKWAIDASVVVSTFPFASLTIGRLKELGVITVPTVTYLTDPAPHRLWIHKSMDYHLTVTPATAAAGIRDYGVPMQPVGGLVGAGFHDPRTQLKREVTRASLGLPATGPVVLIVAGSEGMGDIPGVVGTLSDADIADVIILCGRNKRLRKQLDGMHRVLPLGWRKDVPDLMAAADVLVHNAGGLSLTEALTAGLPAVTFKPIPGHGLANARVLEESGLVPWPRDDEDLIRQVLQSYATGRQDNDAVARECEASTFVLSLLASTPPIRPHTLHPVRSSRFEQLPRLRRPRMLQRSKP